jgi:hypothetical protein
MLVTLSKPFAIFLYNFRANKRLALNIPAIIMFLFAQAGKLPIAAHFIKLP